MLQWNKLVKYLNILNVIDLMWMLILPQPKKTYYLEKIIYKKKVCCAEVMIMGS